MVSVLEEAPRFRAAVSMALAPGLDGVCVMAESGK